MFELFFLDLILFFTIMKRILQLLLLSLSAAFLTSCLGASNDTEMMDYNLDGTKWITTSWDYSTGDDWVTIYDESLSFYFYSHTEGLMYYSKKVNDSDFGSSAKRYMSHFRYEIEEDGTVYLSYTTDPIWPDLFSLRMSGGVLYIGDDGLKKGHINARDYTWLSTLMGKTGDCRWYYNSHSLRIIGNGEMDDYASYSDTPWASANCTFNYVYVDDGVTSIGAYAFANPSIGTVRSTDGGGLPETVKTIKPYSFAGSSITEIDLGVVVEIGEGAFSGCKYLKFVSLPYEIESIGDFAFSDCNRLKVSLYYCSKLRKVGKFAFMGPTVTLFTRSQGLSSVGACAFSNLDIKSLELPDALSSISGLSFNGKFSRIVLGKNVHKIDKAAFVSTASSGVLYVGFTSPLNVEEDFLCNYNGESAIRNWTLYVPKGCKSSFSKQSPWNKFEAIEEYSSL